MRTDLRKSQYTNLFKRVSQFLYPYLPLFAGMLIIQSIQLVISYCLLSHVGIGLIMGTISWAYILTIPRNFISSKIFRGIYSGMVLVASALLGLLELFCAVRLGELVKITHIAIIANTNYNESVEFLTYFIDFKFIIIVLSIAILAVATYRIIRKIKSKAVSGTLTVISLCSLIVTIYFRIWPECGIGRALDSIMALYEIVSYELSESQPEFDVCETSSIHPDIILIIGESFDKNHSNLYGYGKETNPLLTKREKDSTLVVFSSVKSPAPSTNLAFRQILSHSDRYDDDSWYEYPMLPTALSKSGYRTYWLSNQCATSLYDRTISEIAYLCDSVVYTTDHYLDQSANNTVYDDILFLPFREFVRTSGEGDRNFCVVHLMGSHFRFDLRYPDKYAVFTASDYMDQQDDRREIFASYDNSILFNDYIVDSLMNIADRLDAVVIYISDHGLDFYYTQDCASHGRHSIPASFDAGCQIPFMIYFTTPFREKHPEIVERTRSIRNKEFNTNYLMNTILDIAGYDLQPSIYKESLFEGKFSSDSDSHN